MENDSKAVKTAWTVWGIFVIAYLAMNIYVLNSETLPKENIVPGFGLGMPIICNLSWWAIGFRLRYRIHHWWIFGIATTLVVGIAGFLTMLTVARGLHP